MGGLPMRRTAVLLLVMTAGCSTAPLADLMDYFHPSHLDPEPGPLPVNVCPAPAPVGPMRPVPDAPPPVQIQPFGPSGPPPVIGPGAPRSGPPPVPPAG